MSNDAFEDYEEPQLGDTSKFEVRANPDHKLLIKVNGYEPKFSGSFAKEPGPAVFVHVADFSAKDPETGKRPHVYPNVAWMGGSLVDGIKALLDKKGPGVQTMVVSGKKRGKSGYEYGTLSPVDAETKGKILEFVGKNGNPFDGIEAANTTAIEAAQKIVEDGGLDEFDDGPTSGGPAAAEDDAF